MIANTGRQNAKLCSLLDVFIKAAASLSLPYGTKKVTETTARGIFATFPQHSYLINVAWCMCSGFFSFSP